MPIMLRKLNDMVGKEVLVVQLDGKAYKGRLSEIDERALHLTHALEFAPSEKRWKIPTISVPPESSVEGDVVKTDKMEAVKMRDIILAFAGILRIYPLATKGEPPKSVISPSPFFAKAATPAPAKAEPEKQSSGGYYIRSVSGSSAGDDKDKDKKDNKW